MFKELLAKITRKRILCLQVWWVPDWKLKIWARIRVTLLCYRHQGKRSPSADAIVPPPPCSPNGNTLWASAWIRASGIAVLTDLKLRLLPLTLKGLFIFKLTYVFKDPTPSYYHTHISVIFAKNSALSNQSFSWPLFLVRDLHAWSLHLVTSYIDGIHLFPLFCGFSFFSFLYFLRLTHPVSQETWAAWSFIS